MHRAAHLYWQMQPYAGRGILLWEKE